jgi:hypothetical protein
LVSRNGHFVNVPPESGIRYPPYQTEKNPEHMKNAAFQRKRKLKIDGVLLAIESLSPYLYAAAHLLLNPFWGEK